MSEKPEPKFLPKQQLEITKYEADIPYGTAGKTLDRAHAKNLSLPDDSPFSGKPIRMTVFNGELKTYLHGQGEGAVITADVKETPRPDTPYGPDFTIVQVYDDQGQPVSQKRRSGGGWGKSPQEAAMAMERRSIEAQTAFNGIIALMASAPEDEDLKAVYKKALRWANNRLDDTMTPWVMPVAATPPTGQALSSTSHKQAPPVAEDTNAFLNSPIKHRGDLFKRASMLKPPLTPDDLVVNLELNKPEDITDLEAAWKMAQQISASRRAKE